TDCFCPHCYGDHHYLDSFPTRRSSDLQLAGYWGHKDVNAAMDVCLDVIRAHADKVDGIKISLLDADKEIVMRRQLPDGVKMYTRSEEHTSELQSRENLVCRLLLEKKKK